MIYNAIYRKNAGGGGNLTLYDHKESQSIMSSLYFNYEDGDFLLMLTYNNYYGSSSSYFSMNTWVIRFSIKGQNLTFVDGYTQRGYYQQPGGTSYSALSDWPYAYSPSGTKQAAYGFYNGKLYFNFSAYNYYSNHVSYGMLFKL